MRRLVTAFALAGALGGSLGGCAYYSDGPSPPPPAPPLPRRPPIDACGASSLQYLMGRRIDDIPQSYSRHEQRVIGQRVYVEDHYNPERLTIIYDDDTGRITRVRCG